MLTFTLRNDFIFNSPLYFIKKLDKGKNHLISNNFPKHNPILKEKINVMKIIYYIKSMTVFMFLKYNFNKGENKNNLGLLELLNFFNISKIVIN